MGGFALPALHVNPPQQQEPLTSQIGQILALKNQMALAPLQQQEAQQRVQSGQLELQQQQQAVKDQQAFRDAMADPSMQGKTLGDIADTLARKGGLSAQTYSALKKADIEQRQSLATLDKDQLANAKAAHEQTQQLYNNVLNMPDDQLAQNWPQIAQQYDAIPGNQKMPLNPQQPLTKDQLKQFAPFVSMQNAYIDDALARQEKVATGQKTAAEAAKAQYDLTQRQANGGLTPAELETQRYHTQEIGVRNRQLGIEGARLKFEQSKNSLDQSQSALTGDDFLKTLPGGTQSQVKAMANGDIAVPSASARNPQAQQLRTAVLTYDPTYTDARYKGKQDFKNKGDANSIMQLSTAMEHADRALVNSPKAGFAPALGNKTLESGASAAYMQDAEFLTGEVGKLVKNGVLTVDEGNKISSGLTSARQGVRDSALSETMDLLGGKTRALFQKYKTGTGQDLPVNEFFDSKSQQRLQKYGLVEGQQAQGNSGGLSVTAPNGKVYTFKDQASADAFKQKAGIQ